MASLCEISPNDFSSHSLEAKYLIFLFESNLKLFEFICLVSFLVLPYPYMSKFAIVHEITLFSLNLVVCECYYPDTCKECQGNNLFAIECILHFDEKLSCSFPWFKWWPAMKNSKQHCKLSFQNLLSKMSWFRCLSRHVLNATCSHLGSLKAAMLIESKKKWWKTAC